TRSKRDWSSDVCSSDLFDGLKGYNAIGCRRAGIGRESIAAIRAAYQCLHTHRTTPAVVEAIRALGSSAPEVQEILSFIAGTKREIGRAACRERVKIGGV